MIFNIDKSHDSNLGTKLEKTPTPQGLEQTAKPQVTPVVTPRLPRGGWVGEYIDCCIKARIRWLIGSQDSRVTIMENQ